MKKNRITVHVLIKNEDKWIWFALQSVLPFAEKILIFDTGSTDNTVQIIKSIKSSKIIFEEKGEVQREDLAKLRQEQLDRTETEWFLLLDGDEIWPDAELDKLLGSAVKAPNNVVAMFNRTRNCVGDIYHYLSDSSGGYKIGGMKGHLNIRLIKKSETLKVKGCYPNEFYEDNNGQIQKQQKKLIFTDCWYLHTTFLPRTSLNITKNSGSLGRQKIWEQGISLKDEELPRVFSIERPLLVDDPLVRRTASYEILSYLVDPLLKIKRKVGKR